MALPTPTDLKTMNWAYLGQPFVQVPAKTSIHTLTMDWAYIGQPFVVNDTPAAAPGWAHKYMGISNPSKVNGVTFTKIMGI